LPPLPGSFRRRKRAGGFKRFHFSRKTLNRSKSGEKNFQEFHRSRTRAARQEDGNLLRPGRIAHGREP
jgi:hypothetical protein